MKSYICKTCGAQYAATDGPPDRCIICEDERQYIGWNGQQWTTVGEMRSSGYRNEFMELEPGLTGIRTQPGFAISQMAMLLQTPDGNCLWDSLSYIDEDTFEKVRALGGIQAIGVSHPHFYSSIVEWSHAFDNAPIYIPYADKEWITRSDPSIRFWEGAKELFPGVTLIQCGGHFEGSAVLHWSQGARGKGVLLVGDTLGVVQDRRYVSFMRSYPNLIPLPESSIRRIVKALEPYKFDRIYGAWPGKVVSSDAKAAVRRSAERYIEYIRG